MALNNNLTLILAMSTVEAGRYLETYKLCESTASTGSDSPPVCVRCSS